MSELGAEIAAALREVYSGAQTRPTIGVTATVGTKPTDLERKVFCADCLEGSPPSYDHVIRNGSHPTGSLSIKRSLSYDVDAVTAGVKAGTHGKSCMNCGFDLK